MQNQREPTPDTRLEALRDRSKRSVDVIRKIVEGGLVNPQAHLEPEEWSGVAHRALAAGPWAQYLSDYPTRSDLSRLAEWAFATGIRKRREQLGLSQAQLAAILERNFGIKLDATAITRIEANAAHDRPGARAIRLGEAIAIAIALAMPLDQLVGLSRLRERESGLADHDIQDLEDSRARLLRVWSDIGRELADLDHSLALLREIQQDKIQSSTDASEPHGETNRTAVEQKWPNVLGELKRANRDAWLRLKEYGPYVAAVRQHTLTLGFWNPKDRDHFLDLRYDESLEHVLNNIFGGDWTVEAETEPAPFDREARDGTR